VQLEDVNIVGAELLERIVEARHRVRGGGTALAQRDPRLGRDHDTVARNGLDRLANDAFRAVDRGGVEQIDPEIERLAHERHGFRLALAGPEPEPAEAAAAQPGDADHEPGAAEPNVLHSIEPFRLREGW
jgi:hypothetical protein